jgi:hypothetical protein
MVDKSLSIHYRFARRPEILQSPVNPGRTESV